MHLTHDHPVSTPKIAVSDVLNAIFVATVDVPKKAFAFNISGTCSSISIGHRETLDIDSDFVCLTVTKVFKNHKPISPTDLSTFGKGKLEEINFLLKLVVTSIPVAQVPDSVEIQPLK